ncbi:unnamed protein product [Acanthoscelides obtectus]|uniref:Uncharacterized protein n=1 Tax=Acanthoscelides obtectus TaxID=200917 RepID=A0A9P0PVF6_ACAOB|nr:unnamed protein product [Acanthoscelides obtectus]CAH2014245.1 unnamed protein product [Acanthoscelides obtectus]CAK1643547.1 hypothetical protein AOBTE_LOCUS13573 [Acanthoscelides obtectus]CAK1643581.1 hypothetical protein AOBTE_LOCUS13589 [Acanthoscelides obtectus]
MFLDECCLYSLKLLTIKVSSDGLTRFQKLIMENSTSCRPNTQQNLAWCARTPWACVVPSQ